jgi:hypothetical protein
MRFFVIPPPPPLPRYREALLYLPNLKAAVERFRRSRNATEAEDALRVIRFYTDAIEKVLKSNQ